MSRTSVPFTDRPISPSTEFDNLGRCGQSVDAGNWATATVNSFLKESERKRERERERETGKKKSSILRIVKNSVIHRVFTRVPAVSQDKELDN